MSAGTENPPPEPAQGKPVESQAERAAESQVSANNERRDSPVSVSDNRQEPTQEVQQRSDEGGSHEEKRERSNLWTKTKGDPVAFFTLTLAVSTIVLAIATVVLAGATIALWWATEKHVSHAQHQSEALQTSLEIAKETADANREAAKIARDTFHATAEGQRAFLNVASAELRNLDTWANNLLEAHVRIKNNGPVQATLVRIASRLVIANPKQLPCTIQIRGAATVIDPGGEHEITVAAEGRMTDAQRRSIADGTAMMVVYGRIEYSDPRSKGRFRQFRLGYTQRAESGFRRETGLRMTHIEGCGNGN